MSKFDQVVILLLLKPAVVQAVVAWVFVIPIMFGTTLPPVHWLTSTVRVAESSPLGTTLLDVTDTVLALAAFPVCSVRW